MARPRLPLLIPLPFVLLACTDLRCPSFGFGGDSELNRLKNRASAPDTSREMTVPAFMQAFPPDMHTPKEHDEFTQAQKDSIEPRERMGISLVGYLVQAMKALPELSNCLDPEDEDWHLNIAAIGPSPDTGILRDTLVGQSVITEVSPKWQDKMKGRWTFGTLDSLARSGAQVRISGWAMYDPEHPNHLGHLRGSLWEIHPVTGIEIRVDTGWVRLEDMGK